MATKAFRPEQIINKLREAEGMLSEQLPLMFDFPSLGGTKVLFHE
jgi:hypothetical protein